jgi:hypothetical protein
MTARLEEAGGSIGKAVESYRTVTSRSIQRIESRFNREHNVLAKKWDEHGAKFKQSVQIVRNHIAESGTRRERITGELKRGLVRRRLLYEDASKCLRSYQDRLAND